MGSRCNQISSCSIESPARSKKYRMESPLKPEEERIQVALGRPRRRNSAPAVQLFLKDLGADLSEILDGFFLSFAFRQQVNRGLEPQVVECQLGTGRIDSVKPIQKRLRWFNHDCGTVDRFMPCA